MKKRNSPLSFVHLSLITLVLAGLMLFHPASADAQAPYKIGVTNSVTGYAAGLGASSKNGIIMAVDEINKKGGVGGHKLELVMYDNRSDDSTAVLNARKLIEADKVDALIVGAYSGACFASLDTAERSKIPMFSISAGTKLWKPTRPYSFCVVPSGEILERVRARWIKEKGYTRVAELWLNVPAHEEYIGFFAQEAKNFGLTVVANEQHKANDTDMSVHLSKIVAAKPDIIKVSDYAHTGAIIAKNAKSLGMNIPFLACYAVTGEVWLNLAKNAAEGWYGAVVSHQLGTQTPPWRPTYPIVAAFAESYHKRFGESITATSGNSYDSAYLIAAGLKAVGEEPDLARRREKLRYAIENLENFFCLNGPYYMSSNNHNGTGEWAISIVKILNGKMVLQ